jgi:hypothetical protein
VNEAPPGLGKLSIAELRQQEFQMKIHPAVGGVPVKVMVSEMNLLR